MGNGVCSRRQRRIFQCLLLVTVVCGMFYGGMMSYEMHKQLRRTEAMALKYQQHQESLSAQLQVVYEHRSRLEKSLQKERLEHKKAKEDYLSYKLEAQQSINKEKQDSISRLNSLQVQHQILKNQHEDLKKQYYDLQDQHQAQGDDHNRQLDEHRERYDKLQQIKELEVSQLKDSMFNLREENKQLRKAHHDIHTQLQDAQVRHQDLKAAHDQLALNLQDHKSALAAAQVQVDEYKQLKESLNAASNLGQHHPNTPQHQPVAVDTPESRIHEAEKTRVLDLPNKDKPGHFLDQEESESRLGELGQSDKEGEAERRRELEEEEMAQAGKPEKLEEDLDQPQQEEDEQPEPQQPDENTADQKRGHSQQSLHQQDTPLEHMKSPFDQHLEAQRAEERRRIQLRQADLQLQREREQRLKEEQQHTDTNREEQQSLSYGAGNRRRTAYENMDTDIVQGEEDHHTDDEDRDTHLLNEEEEEEEMKVEQKVPPHQQAVIDGELDPEDDPNNQGEDEFDEAEDEQPQHRVTEEEDEEEPAALGQHRDTHSHQEPPAPAVEEELVMAGNPDQQEDTVDDQYQEDLEDEAQEDVAGGQKRDVMEEDPYNEDIEQKRPKKVEDQENEEDNYEEEEEEVENHVVRVNKGTNRRAEM
ncbi:Golgi integral membrane protein 4a isoform X1 [Takifugu flavidus]|uniref:Golgi integral membrane protein 4a isoform X1 n=1 Tax=Takifugu flavidus TaxID=433684 RepID=UPI0025446258|nr:Golgi integral membrane protein 4a isoform X1 [Takifugu flavidus]